MTLPEWDVSFFFAALGQLDPDRRRIFLERVGQILGSHPDPGPGDVDRSIRQAWEGLWTPSPDEVLRSPSRWHRSAASFERISKAAEPRPELRHHRIKPGFGCVPA